jgi:hypothetical protein
MKCDKAQEFFSDYIENTLDQPMVVAVETHLSGCEACSTDVASLRDMWTVLDRVPQVEPPADFVWRTTTRLQNELLNRREAERARPLPWWKRLSPVQTLSYVGVAALLLMGVAFPFRSAIGNTTGWDVFGWLTHNHNVPVVLPAPRITAPQFTVQVPGANGLAAVVTVTATSEMPYASAGRAYLTPLGERLVGQPSPAHDPQSLAVGQSFSVPIQAGAAYAVRINVDSMHNRFSKVLILAGAPSVTGPIQTDDPYFALEQVANRTGRAMLVDAGWKDKVTLDLQSGTPDQALQSLLTQIGAHTSTETSGVIDITR